MKGIGSVRPQAELCRMIWVKGGGTVSDSLERRRVCAAAGRVKEWYARKVCKGLLLVIVLFKK